MHYSNFILLGLLTAGACSSVFAQETPNESADQSNTTENQATTEQKNPTTIQAIKDLKHLTKNDLKVNANAAQPDAVKDPLQPLNRQIYAFNDMLDRNILKPVAIQYIAKVPEEVRSPYRRFRKNLGEPWNAVNQFIQGRPTRAAKSLGRFTINTLTTLGFADPASRLGLETEDENFGTTLGYWGVPSGPYLVLPVFGPSTFRDGFGLVIDGYARPQRYILEDEEGLYWAELTLRGIDVRSQLIDIEGAIQGDKYSSIRDIYLQRKNFIIAEKKGQEAEGMFIDDVSDDDSSSSPSTNESHQMLDTE